ncbi:MlaA family lipoprotein [Facilibium subflavum]|uniref:MlaA family lipoprotein n=1 Tax=Facilibium subflavum TaxID=2219058 RepID=UPI000E64601C|nr:VacJ family lipoprotein [Facilibium subflavum]
MPYIKSITMGLCSALLLSGCATQQNRDPLEGYNRAIFAFNQVSYDYALIPLANGYDYVVPDPVQNGIDNAYNNILEPGRMANDLLQLNVYYFLKDTARFVANTVFGVFGLFDVAKTMGLPRRQQNFGFTLAYWGYKTSPYFVVPLFGPSTIGNSIGDIVDTAFNPLSYTYVAPKEVGWSAFGIYKANQGVQYLPQYKKLTNSAIDPYVAVRNAYLQNYDYEMAKTLQLKPTKTQQQEEAAQQQQVLDILNNTSP